MPNLITAEGIILSLPHHRMVESGHHKGTWWRVDEIFHNGTEWMVRASRKHGTARARWVFHPAALGLSVVEELTHLRRALNHSHHVWQKVDEWFWAGVCALPALAVFEHYHLADVLFVFG